MATLYTQQSNNVWKTWLLMTVFFVIITLLGFFFSQRYGNPNFLYLFFGISILMNIGAYWFSDKIVLSLSSAKEAKREEYFDLYTAVENLSITAGLPMPKVYVIEDSAPNAFATGRDKNHAVVAVSTGLLSIMNKTELEGVVAHELSHIGNRDILLSTVIVVLVGLVSIVSDMMIRISIFGGRDREDRSGGGVIAIIGIIFSILAPIFAMLIQLAISRKREFLADASASLLTRYPEGLASALEKLQNYSAPMSHQSSAIAHLYISDPKGVSFGKKVTGLFSTHPPLEDRIRILREMK